VTILKQSAFLVSSSLIIRLHGTVNKGKLKEDSDDFGILILQKKTFYSEEQDLKGLSTSFKSINQYFEVSWNS